MAESNTVLAQQDNTEAGGTQQQPASDTVSRDTKPGANSTETPESKGDGAATETPDSKPADAEKPTGAPETYEDFTIPEGMEVDKDALAKFGPLAKELNLTQEQAQAFVDIYTTRMQDMNEATVEAWTKVREGWVTDGKADKEFGGANYDTNVATAKKAIEKFGGDSFREALNTTGMGDHPEMIRFLWKVGQAISEDGVLPGNATGPEKTLAQRLFPSHNK